jgi:hypothetical protein
MYQTQMTFRVSQTLAQRVGPKAPSADELVEAIGAEVTYELDVALAQQGKTIAHLAGHPGHSCPTGTADTQHRDATHVAHREHELQRDRLADRCKPQPRQAGTRRVLRHPPQARALACLSWECSLARLSLMPELVGGGGPSLGAV